MPRYDVTAYTPNSAHGEFDFKGIVTAEDRSEAFEDALKRWPDVPPHRLFIERQNPQGGTQVPPGEPNGAE